MLRKTHAVQLAYVVSFMPYLTAIQNRPLYDPFTHRITALNNRLQSVADTVTFAPQFFMRQFSTIAANAFMELIRQPVFLLLMTASVLFEIFLAVPYYFAFGDEPKLIKNSALAVMLLSGLLGAVLSASSALAREIRAGTVLAGPSQPVGRAQFLLAKYAGLAGG